MKPSNVEHMRWHKEGQRDKPNFMMNPADAEAWKHFDGVHPEFTEEVRNVRLGLTTDEFTPYSSNAAPYSCWPIFVFPYNLPPDLLMREEIMFLALLILSPKHPGRDIDVLLQPLVDELNDLWSVGKET
jgi:Transposase family tnp2